MTYRSRFSSPLVSAVGLLFAVSAPFTLAACGDSGDSSGETQSGGTDGSGSNSASESGGTDASGYGTSAGPGDPSGGDDSAGETGQSDDTGDEESSSSSSGGEAKCDADEDVVLYLSPDDSNSMSSPVQARESVLGGWAQLHWVAIRTWEFMNYYTFDYPAAAPGEVSLTTELVAVKPLDLEAVDEKAAYTLQIGVGSEALSNDNRPPLNITLVLDESGSMGGLAMDMQKESCRAIASSLKEGDTVSVVTWDTVNAVRLGGYNVDGPDDPGLLDVIEALNAGGGTNLEGGLKAGYELAQQVYDPERINRIVLISDGGANTGITEENLIAEHAGANDQDGIYMVGVGVGEARDYNDSLMDTVTDLGKGASVFVSDADEAWKVFGDDFVNTIAVSARDVQVELTLPPGFEIVKFSGEEYSENPEEIEPQHLSPNDAMVFHQQIETCAPELADEEAPISVTVNYKDPITFEARTLTQEATFGELLGQSSPNLLKGAAVFKYAEALKAHKSGGVDEAMADAFAALDLADAALPGDPELAEIRSVLDAL